MKKGSMAINFDGIEINGVKYKYWDEKTKKDFWEGFESNTLGNPNKYPYYSSTSSNTGSNGNDHWTDKFNIGDPDEDEGHWVTLKNHKHIFIKDNDGQQRTSSSSNAKSYNSSNYTSGSDNRKRTEEHITRKQKELEEDNKRRIANKEVNKKSTGETGGAANAKKTGTPDTYDKNQEKYRSTIKEYLIGAYNDYKGIKDPANTIMYALGVFLSNYFQLRDADTHGADKYFHAKANYEAAQQGIVGSLAAKIISDLREITDEYRNIHEKGYTKEYSEQDIKEDQQANEEGRRIGRMHPLAPAFDMLKHLTPNGFLPDRFKDDK